MTTQTPSPVPIAQRLEAARRDLLDLSLRNHLLNHRPSKARGVTFIDEQPGTTYRLLWDEERSFTCTPSATAEDAGERAEPPAPPVAGEDVAPRHRDTSPGARAGRRAGRPAARPRRPARRWPRSSRRWRPGTRPSRPCAARWRRTPRT